MLKLIHMLRNTGIIFFLFSCFIYSVCNTGCASMGLPTGGPRDSLAPVLINAKPGLRAVQVTGKTITLNFDEYIDIQDAQTNIIFSPLQIKTPTVRSALRTISITYKDSLQPNTTYSINFGNAIKDVNEGNVFKDFIYTFSTGNFIDSLTLSGKVLMAETGTVDSTLQVYLYQDGSDTAVKNNKPKYISRVTSSGDFYFSNLPAADFHVYALKDGDGSRSYNNTAEIFGFIAENKTVKATSDSGSIYTLYAYSETKKSQQNIPFTTPKVLAEKNPSNYLKVNTPPVSRQDLLQMPAINFSRKIDPSTFTGIILTDTFFKPIPNTRFIADSLGTTLSIDTKMEPGKYYAVLLDKNILKDTSGRRLFKSDTLRFSALALEDYGRLKLTFTNFNKNSFPVLQILQNNEVKITAPLKEAVYINKMVLPGEYTIRILFDKNNNGVWDAGNFDKLKQPELVKELPQKLGIRSDWDNESEINL